jgi:beta-glucosidase/6-phospho-beta-glucosidase/beta-galactosidase
LKVQVNLSFIDSRREEKPCSWSDPDRELQLAKGTNATVFHMGIDWNRIMPEEPLDGFEKAVSFCRTKKIA